MDSCAIMRDEASGFEWHLVLSVLLNCSHQTAVGFLDFLKLEV